MLVLDAVGFSSSARILSPSVQHQTKEYDDRIGKCISVDMGLVLEVYMVVEFADVEVG